MHILNSVRKAEARNTPAFTVFLFLSSGEKRQEQEKEGGEKAGMYGELHAEPGHGADD